MSKGQVNGKQIIDNTVVKTLNGLTASDQYILTTSDSNVTLNIATAGSTHSLTVGWNGVLPLNRGGLSNSTFTASQILIVNSGTSAVVSSGYKFNDGGTSSTDIWTANRIINYVGTTGLGILNGLSTGSQFLTSSSDLNVKLNIVSSGSTHSYNLTWSGQLPLDRGGLSNSTFTASQILIVNSGTSAVVSSGYRFNDSGTASTDIWSARQSIDNIITLTLEGGRATNNTTNTYLQSNGIPFNVAPLLMPFNGTIKYISVYTGAVSTWVGEVRNNGTPITGATISSSGIRGTYSSYNVNVNAGDLLQLYCNGTSVDNPTMRVLIVKR